MLIFTAGGQLYSVQDKRKALLKLSDGSIKRITNILYGRGIGRKPFSVGCFLDQHYLVEFLKLNALFVTWRPYRLSL